MKPVLIIGAGFSGLTLAYSLRKLGLPVRVLEKGQRAGGLISTHSEEHGLVETAANALLADHEVEELFSALSLEFAAQLKTRKIRYIYWNKPRRWPLSLWTTLKCLKIPLMNFLTVYRVRPHAGETVSQWARRVVNAQFEERLLAPALQGVYAGDVQRMSGVLALNALFRKTRRGRRRGSVAPQQGMGELIASLERQLAAMDVKVEYGTEYRIPEKLEQPTVICTSAWAASEVIGAYDPVVAETLARCEPLPLVSLTAFFPTHKKDLKGFGCLFPQAQGFKALGVLFNESIFAGRSSARSETWIFGGAKNREAVSLSDEELVAAMLSDRQKLSGQGLRPLSIHIARWPKAIPHYTVEWEDRLRHLKVNRPLFLHGNYLGQLGLARIFRRSKALAAQLKDLYVS